MKRSTSRTSQNTTLHEQPLNDITPDEKKLYIDSVLNIKPFFKAPFDIESIDRIESWNYFPHTRDASTSKHPIQPDIVSDCAICLEAFQTGDDISTSIDVSTCHHQYHKRCITEWLMKCYQCPVCRSNYIPNQTQPPQTSSSPLSTMAIEPDTTNVEISEFPSDSLPANIIEQ